MYKNNYINKECNYFSRAVY